MPSVSKQQGSSDLKALIASPANVKNNNNIVGVNMNRTSDEGNSESNGNEKININVKIICSQKEEQDGGMKPELSARCISSSSHLCPIVTLKSLGSF